jgi:peptide/nickel transport system substrate-binding protein
MMDSWEPQRQFVLKKNPNYWKEGLPYVDELILVSIVEDTTRVDAVRSGELDAAEYLPWQEFDRMANDGFGVFRHNDLLGFTMLNVNRPPLDNQKLRQALAYIVDTQSINELAFGGQASAIDGPLQPQDSPYYFKDLEGYYAQDLDKARALLKEAGYDDPSQVPPLQMKTRGAGSYYSEQPAKIIQQEMTEFGLTVEWEEVMDTPTLVENRAKGTYMMHQDGRGLSWPDPDYLREFFHSVEGTGYATGVGYKNEQLDQLLEQGYQTLDEGKRKEIYRQVEQIILDDVPWIFTIWRPQAEGVAPYVKGFEAYPNLLGKYNISRFEYIWLDK